MTGAIRRYRLPTHDSPVSWVDADSYPAAGGCHLVCLSERQCAIIRDMVYPMALQPTRFAKRLYGEIFTYGDELIWSEHLAEVHDLLYQIGEASNMACTELVSALTALAAAIEASAGGSSGQTVVNCGGGASPTAGGQLLQCITGDITDILPREDIVEPDEETEDPPEGFETWEEYRTYKCQAAHWVFDTIVNGLRNLGAAQLTASSLSLLAGVVGAALGILTGALALPAVIAIVGSLAQLEILAAGANSLMRQLADYMAERRSTIICAMYNSGSAADATAILTSALEDAIEALVYGAAFEATAGTIAPLLTTVTTYMVDFGITRTLWQLSADVMYPDADCDPCDPYSGYLAAFSSDSPYNVLEQGDSVTAGGSSAENGYQVVSPTPARVYFTTDGAVSSLNLYDEYYHAQNGWTVVGAQIYRASDDADMGSFTVPDSNGSWQTIDATASISLAADTQYYVRLSPSGGNSTWHRRLSLVAL